MFDDPLAVWNGCEALVWMTLAIVIHTRNRRAAVEIRRLAYGLSVFLVLFAVSDVIEMRTGAWWRPWGLLIFKGICLAALVPLFFALVQRQRRKF